MLNLFKHRLTFLLGKMSIIKPTVVYTDGSCFNNGKKGAVAGIGVFWGDKDDRNVGKAFHGRQTNSAAEIYAVITALKTAKEFNIKNLVVMSDSTYVINSMTKWVNSWKKNNWKKSDGKQIENKDLIIELHKLTLQVKPTYKHVKAHANEYGNTQADLLARNGSEEKIESNKMT